MIGISKLQFSLRSFLVACFSFSILLALVLLAIKTEGGLFTVPYHLLGESVLMKLAGPCASVGPVLFIGFVIWICRYGDRPVLSLVSALAITFGLMQLLAAGFSSGFYLLTLFLAPASFIAAVFGVAEVLIRKLKKHIPTSCFALGLSICYWIFTLGLVVVVG